MTDHDTQTHGRPRFAPWLVEPMLRNKATYMKVALAAAMVNMFSLTTSIFSMTVYDRVVPNSAFSSLAALAVGMGIVIIFDFALRVLRVYFLDLAGANIDQDVGGNVFERLTAIRLDKKRGSTGALTGMMRELEMLREFFASATISSIVDVPFIAFTLILIAVIGGPIVFVPMTAIVVVISVSYFSRPVLDRLAARSVSEGLIKQTVLVETVGALEMVKTSGAEPLLGRRWRRAVRHHSRFTTRQRLVSSIATTTATATNTLSYATTVVVGVFLVVDHRITTGALVACSLLSGRALQPLSIIASLLSRLSLTQTAYRHINAMMETGSEQPSETALKPVRFDGRIELRGVEFRYPGSPTKTLDGINLVIPAGQRVAFLGKIGSGKSTVARMILGLYTPQEGIVMIDDIDIRQYDPRVMRSLIGTALQESVLLSGSIRENITLERAHIDDTEMLRASQVAGAHNFVGQMANGYDLKLKDRGEGLSGGQRQAISLARGLAGRPQILVFDEPTSAMDQVSETQLLQRLEAELEGRTFILITHRPSLVKLVDRVVVIDGGKVVQDGPRDTIMQLLQRPRAVA